MLQVKYITETSKFLLFIFAGILILLVIFVGGPAAFFILEQQICAPKVHPAVETFLVQVKNGSYEDFKDLSVVVSREDFENLKREVPAKYSATIEKWKYGAVAFVRVEFASSSTYRLIVFPDGNNMLVCMGKDYKVSYPRFRGHPRRGTG